MKMELDSELITKFNNIFIMYHYSIMTNDTERVRHFLNQEMYETLKKIVEKNINNKETQMYDELNVKNTEIIQRNDLKDRYQVVVRLVSRYIDYIVDSETGNYKRGVKDCRVEKTNLLIFEKVKKFDSKSLISTCPTCGANLDINYTGVCLYCNQSIDLSESDYQLISMEVL